MCIVFCLGRKAAETLPSRAVALRTPTRTDRETVVRTCYVAVTAVLSFRELQRLRLELMLPLPYSELVAECGHVLTALT